LVPVKDTGRVIDYDIRKITSPSSTASSTIYSNLKFAVDCSNGMAALLVKDILAIARCTFTMSWMVHSPPRG
jgi:phosphomannomutase